MERIAVYRSRETEQITRIHKIPEDKHKETGKAVSEYNAAKHEEWVTAVDLYDGGLELFLYQRSELDISRYRDEIIEMQSRLDELNSSMDWLYGAAQPNS